MTPTARLHAHATADREAFWSPDASYRASAGHSKPAFSWPMPDEELNEIEGIHTVTRGAVTDAAVAMEAVAVEGVTTEEVTTEAIAMEAPQRVDIDLDEPVWRVSRTPPVLQITSPDPRSYLAGLYRERLDRQRRVQRIAAVVAGAFAPLVLITLLQMNTTTARAVAGGGPVTMPVASVSVSAPVGILAVVSATQVAGHLADHLVPTLRAGADAAPAKPPLRHRRSRGFRFDRVNGIVSRRKRPR
jgi:hypothetical protein